MGNQTTTVPGTSASFTPAQNGAMSAGYSATLLIGAMNNACQTRPSIGGGSRLSRRRRRRGSSTRRRRRSSRRKIMWGCGRRKTMWGCSKKR
jgi:hypothetical protein